MFEMIDKGPAVRVEGLAIALLLLTVLLFSPSFAGELATRAEVTLRDQPAVSADKITLGDIFDGTGAAGATLVANSPVPGQSVLIESKSLDALLAAHNLVWSGVAQFTMVRIERLAREIRTSEITDAIASSLAHASGRTLEVRLQQSALVLKAPVTVKGPPEVEILAFDGRSGSFDAIVRAQGGDQARVSGIAEEVMDIPVLARPIQRGETISEADLSSMHARIAFLSRNTVTDAKALIGLAARRPLPSGQPLQSADVERPIVITKGALVTIVYEVPGLSLTDQGRALEQGAIGDTISVLNPNSHRTLMATVVSSERVRIEPSALNGANVAQR